MAEAGGWSTAQGAARLHRTREGCSQTAHVVSAQQKRKGNPSGRDFQPDFAELLLYREKAVLN